MKKDNYHHGNLKEELMNKTIDMIVNEGEDSLSMRKLAAACGVTRQAPYSHFENKEALLDACREHVSLRFKIYLEKSIEGENINHPSVLRKMGRAYIDFFKANPSYFSFIYSRGNCKIDLTLEEVEGNYPPFEVFRKVCANLTEVCHIDRKKGLNSLIRAWSVVHGAAALIVSPNVTIEGGWEKCLEEIFDFAG